MKTFITLTLSLFFALSASAASRSKNIATEKKQVDAIIKGQVTDVVCTVKNEIAQGYIATIKVLKTIQGNPPSTLKIQFIQNLDGHHRPGDSKVSFLKGDVSEITLTKYPDHWGVENSSDIKLIISSKGLLPKCN